MVKYRRPVGVFEVEDRVISGDPDGLAG